MRLGSGSGSAGLSWVALGSVVLCHFVMFLAASEVGSWWFGDGF